MGINKNAKVISVLVVVAGLFAAVAVYFRTEQAHESPGSVIVQAPTVVPSAVSTLTPAPTSEAAVNLPSGWTTYTDPSSHLSAGYPASWTFGGIEDGKGGFSNASSTGFFSMGDDLFQRQVSLDDVVKTDCNHLLQPCGAKPIIQTLTVAGQDARLVWPSKDSRGNPNEVYLYVSPPTHCGFIYIEVAKDYVRDIIRTMKFQTVPSSEDMCTSPTPTSTPSENPALLQSPPPPPPPPAP